MSKGVDTRTPFAGVSKSAEFSLCSCPCRVSRPVFAGTQLRVTARAASGTAGKVCPGMYPFPAAPARSLSVPQGFPAGRRAGAGSRSAPGDAGEVPHCSAFSFGLLDWATKLISTAAGQALASVSQAEFSCSMRETEAELLSWHGMGSSIWPAGERSGKQPPSQSPLPCVLLPKQMRCVGTDTKVAESDDSRARLSVPPPNQASAKAARLRSSAREKILTKTYDQLHSLIQPNIHTPSLWWQDMLQIVAKKR
nr:uncharacterized protein LOC110360053 isoform X2 [Columba livia]